MNCVAGVASQALPSAASDVVDDGEVGGFGIVGDRDPHGGDLADRR